jgi:hypothetical protein
MNYQIIITKTEPNPNYAAELVEYNKLRYAYDSDRKIEPKVSFERSVLSCELTEEQFKKVKLEALKVFE